MVAFGGGGASLVDDDSDRVHHEDEGDMSNPNLGSLGPRDAPERAGDKGWGGGGCGSEVELGGGSWVHNLMVLRPGDDDHTVKATGRGAGLV
jgi:hypothetical protein